MTPKQTELFKLIKSQFFVDPAPANWPEYLGRLQAVLAVQIGNVVEWYLRGFQYTSLDASLKQVSALETKFAELARERNNLFPRLDSQPDDYSPLVKAENWSLSKIELPFVEKEIQKLVEALPTVDTDTGGAIRFNHHFIGELHPQGNIIALAAAIVAAFLNENVVVGKVSPSVTTWEKRIVHWIWHMLDGSKREACARCYSDGAFENSQEESGNAEDRRSGRIVAGGTIANLTAFFIAREKFRSWCKQTERKEIDLNPVVLYSGHSHYSITKVARIVGFSESEELSQSQIIPVLGENYWFLTAKDVKDAIQEASDRGQHVIMVCALAGATDTGFVDDLNGIADVIAEYNNNRGREGPPIYYHIDAAMGGPFRLIESLRWDDQNIDFAAVTPKRAGELSGAHLFNGLNRGDAITIDGHKYFYCNYPCGGIFVSKEEDFDCLEENPGYLPHEPEVNSLAQALGLGDTSPLSDLEEEGRDHRGLRTLEGSRGIIGITQLYCTLKAFGPDGFEALLQNTLDMTAFLRDLISRTKSQTDGLPALELITNGPLNQTLFRVVNNWQERTRASEIDLDNRVNQLLPLYASWTQTRESQPQVLRDKIRELPLVPFFVGADQLLGKLPKDEKLRIERIDTFLDYVWRINGEAVLQGGQYGCPPENKKGVHDWINSNKDSPRPLQVLKGVITHPYTDKSVLEKFVESIRLAAAKIREAQEKSKR